MVTADTFIKWNPSIEEVVNLIKVTGRKGKKSKTVNFILQKFPYGQYADKYKWLHDVFWFIHKCVEYRLDEPGKEQIKEVDRFVIKDNAGDCDDYSTLWIAILTGAISGREIVHYVKIVKYTPAGEWAHVYIVVPATNGKTIVLDNVIKQFDKEVTFVTSKIF